MIVEHETFCIVVYKNSSDQFDIGHCQIQAKITVTTGLQNFSYFAQLKLSGTITQIWFKLGG